jgi:hypothetical protein
MRFEDIHALEAETFQVQAFVSSTTTLVNSGAAWYA